MSSGGGAYWRKMSTISVVNRPGNSRFIASIIASQALRCPPPVSEKRKTIFRFSGLGRRSISTSWQDRFETTCQLSPGQQHPPFAAAAFQADISPQAHNFPVKTSAWMRLSQAYNVLQF